ncbi:uncharacterized protein FOKN1_0265 [Thiohalobacter thiocyanaticus]|uniref:RRM domain-containing protein n=2 Tax=Thiohalobacteraceae TaxID=3085110 RepID=A0A1Z4VM34_9GAMM|nr:uncharacterized protein FOKN1_0265 [Thiohalobacter thiocyanaticus]
MLFIGNLPQSATTARLADALRLGHEDAHRLRIIRKPGRHGGVQRYAVLQVRTPAAANRLLGRSNKIKLNGQPLELREFCKRIANNERRALNWRSKTWPHAERRCNERRCTAGERQAA